MVMVYFKANAWVLDHIGYELPWYLDLLSCLPGVGGTKFHDDHHKYFNVNFAFALVL